MTSLLNLTPCVNKQGETQPRRIKARDPNDWEVVALAMHFDCPIWTEDKDFFGIGIATWNSQNVEIYLMQ